MSQRFQQAGGVVGPPQSPQQARYSQPMPQPPMNSMRPYAAGPTQNFPVSETIDVFFRENISECYKEIYNAEFFLNDSNL